MEITGKITAVLPATEGVSRAGNKWKKQEYVLETHEQYAKKVCFGLFGVERIEQAAIREGEELTVYFDLESREFNGKWYTNVNAWKIERGAASAASPSTYSAATSTAEPSGTEMQDYPPPGADDLPF